MNTLLTKDNITFILAVFGSLGTLISWTFSLISTRKSINVRISKAYLYDNSILLHILIDNKSRLPITITRISLVIGNNIFSTFDTQTQIYRGERKCKGEVLSVNTIYSPTFPIEIGSLGGTNCYPYFELSPEAFETLSTELTLQFHTNRGMVKKKKLSFEPVDSPEKMC